MKRSKSILKDNSGCNFQRSVIARVLRELVVPSVCSVTVVEKDESSAVVEIIDGVASGCLAVLHSKEMRGANTLERRGFHRNLELGQQLQASICSKNDDGRRLLLQVSIS
jgi:hypothetical protein